MSDFISNRDGTCVTSEGLDDLLPRDDRPVDLSDAAYGILFTSKGTMIPDCAPDALTYEEQVAPHDLLTFVFNGDEIHTNIPDIPAPGALELMASVLVMALLMKVKA